MSTLSEKDVKRVLARAAAAKTPEYPAAERMWPASQYGGVLPMSLTGRFENERERLGPEFTDAERRWRIKWYRDQILHPDEPLPVPELYREYYHPMRRFYRAPLEHLEHKVMAPRLVSFEFSVLLTAVPDRLLPTGQSGSVQHPPVLREDRPDLRRYHLSLVCRQVPPPRLGVLLVVVRARLSTPSLPRRSRLPATRHAPPTGGVQ